MDPLPPQLAFLVLLFSGWINRQQQAVIDYLREENRILRAANRPNRVRLTDDQRRRLAVKGKALGRRRLADVAGIVTPDTILRWYRRLVAEKYDGSTPPGIADRRCVLLPVLGQLQDFRRELPGRQCWRGGELSGFGLPCADAQS
jgi:hypothetical protein